MALCCFLWNLNERSQTQQAAVLMEGKPPGVLQRRKVSSPRESFRGIKRDAGDIERVWGGWRGRRKDRWAVGMDGEAVNQEVIRLEKNK